MESSQGLERKLKARHIEMIALGGTIGVGLFMGSASTIETAGPSVLLCYMIAGLIMFLIMRTMGEMLYLEPVTGSFASYAYKYISPYMGYITAWCYWIFWTLTVLAEITAVGIYMTYWFPDLPTWISALGALILIGLANLASVRYYGEAEFWFSLIKVSTIVVMLIIGVAMIVFGIGNEGIPVGFSNLWSHGGFFPHGIGGMLSALCIVSAAFLGVEMIGLTAGEAEHPQETLMRAIKNIVWRILIFYVGAILVILSLYPWNEVGLMGSPFVLTFSRIGITVAAGIINFVVLTAAMSGCNSGIYGCARMLYTLAQHKQAPQWFGKLSKSGVPKNGIYFTIAILLVGVLLNYLIPDPKLFVYIYSASVFPAMVSWFVLSFSQFRFRKAWGKEAIAKHPFKSILFPYGNYLCIIFMILVTIGIFYNDDTRLSLFIGWIFIACMSLVYYINSYRKNKAISHK